MRALGGNRKDGSMHRDDAASKCLLIWRNLMQCELRQRSAIRASIRTVRVKVVFFGSG